MIFYIELVGLLPSTLPPKQEYNENLDSPNLTKFSIVSLQVFLGPPQSAIHLLFSCQESGRGHFYSQGNHWSQNVCHGLDLIDVLLHGLEIRLLSVEE